MSAVPSSPFLLHGAPTSSDLPRKRDIHAGTTLQARGRQAKRAHFRSPVEVCLPIGFQLLNGHRQPVSVWHFADILDVSPAGLCILLTEANEPLPLEEHSLSTLDLVSHADFGVDQIVGEIRWFVRSSIILTLGIAFESALPSWPRLTPGLSSQLNSRGR